MMLAGGYMVDNHWITDMRYDIKEREFNFSWESAKQTYSMSMMPDMEYEDKLDLAYNIMSDYDNLKYIHPEDLVEEFE